MQTAREDLIINGDARVMDVDDFRRYPIIIADPPWYYNDQRKVRKDTKIPTKGIGACHHYGLMTDDELCAMPVAELSAERSLLFLWATCPRIPSALRVMEAWGYDYSTVVFTWVKTNRGIFRSGIYELSSLLWELGIRNFLNKLTFFGPGYYTGSNVELVLLGRKHGVNSIRHGDYKASQVFYGPSLGHSSKPHEIQNMIMKMYDESPRLELFARHPTIGWDVFGNELGKWV